MLSANRKWAELFEELSASQHEPHLLVPSPETGGGDVTSSGVSASEPVRILIW